MSDFRVTGAHGSVENYADLQGVSPYWSVMLTQGVGDEIFVSRPRFARLGYFSAYSVVHFS